MGQKRGLLIVVLGEVCSKSVFPKVRGSPFYFRAVAFLCLRHRRSVLVLSLAYPLAFGLFVLELNVPLPSLEVGRCFLILTSVLYCT